MQTTIKLPQSDVSLSSITLQLEAGRSDGVIAGEMVDCKRGVDDDDARQLVTLLEPGVTWCLGVTWCPGVIWCTGVTWCLGVSAWSETYVDVVSTESVSSRESSLELEVSRFFDAPATGAAVAAPIVIHIYHT